MAKRVLNQWRGYTAADCDCKYCLYYGGRKKGEVNCLAEECVCKEELQEALRRERNENGEDVLEDTECNVEESVMQRMDIERVRTALKMLAPEERAIIQDFFFTESPIPVKELVEKYAMPKTSIYRKRDDALKKLKKILGNA